MGYDARNSCWEHKIKSADSLKSIRAGQRWKNSELHMITVIEIIV